MVSVNDIRAQQRVSRAFCVLVLAVGLGPSRLQAGCSHDVTSKTSRSARGSVVALEILRVTAVQLADNDPYSPIRNRTCSGFSCTRRPGSPSAESPSVEE